MKKYKVEIVRSETFVVDVLAKNEEMAEKKAARIWKELDGSGAEHYFQTGDAESKISTVYDVTDTDDPFNP